MTLARVLVALLACFLTLVFVMSISTDGFTKPAAWVGPAVLAAACWIWLFKLRGVAGKSRFQKMADATQAWIATVQSGQRPPELDTGPLMVPKGETPLLTCQSMLRELVADYVRHYLGSRVSVAGVPFYVGSSSTSGANKKHFRRSDEGRLVITDKKLYFLGITHTVSYSLRDLLAVTPTYDSLLINVSGRTNPIVLTAPNPLLYQTVIRLIHEEKLKVTLTPQ